MSSSVQPVWQDPAWFKQATDWIRAEASRQAIQITGPIEQPHIYPWSTVLRVPTNGGTLFFKATAPETVYETALTQALARWYPDCMPELIAVDAERGWMLMRDGGEQLRAHIRPTQDLAPWNPVVTRYAEVQIGLADHVAEILALGVPDWRLASLPALYMQLLADEDILLIDRPRGLSSSDLRHLQDLAPRFQQICADLSAVGIPESLNHGDLTDGNILLRNGRLTFFDWGDANVTHPFVSLRNVFVSIEISLKLDDWAFTAAMSALLDLYLAPWNRYVTRQALQAAYPLSRCAASIVKALGWRQTVSRLEGSRREEYAWIVPEVMREFLVYEKMLPV